MHDTAAVSADLYAVVEQFYVRQLTRLDDGAVEDWAGMFTEDAVFEEIHRGEPLRGRQAIQSRAQARSDTLAADGVTFRHWLGMLRGTVEDVGPDGQPTALRVLMYALAMATTRGGGLDVKVSVVCRDFLILTGGRWQVRHRDLRHDGTPHAYRGEPAPQAAPPV